LCRESSKRVLIQTNTHSFTTGQSLSVIPPGIDASNGRKHKPRLYSIASTRYGDLLDGNTISLCVRRAEYIDPITGEKDPTKQGVCSNFLCNVKPGDEVSVAGPVGKTMLLPKDPTKDVIMIATGTGIAPFRGFLHRLFMENTLARHMFGGSAWLVLGVPVSGGLLYDEEFEFMVKNGELRAENKRHSTVPIYDRHISFELNVIFSTSAHSCAWKTQNRLRHFTRNDEHCRRWQALRPACNCPERKRTVR
jgi:sulfite reductase alpha subunit-like flavoprotein